MRFFLASIGLLAISVQASNVLIFDTNQTATVRGRAVAYLLSVDTPQYSGRSDVLINPVLPNHPLEWTKTNGAGLVVAMNTAESNSIITVEVNFRSNQLVISKLDAKLEATNALVNFFGSPQGRVIFAFMEASMDRFNFIGTNMLTTTNFPALTLTQLTNAIKTRISAQANNP